MDLLSLLTVPGAAPARDRGRLAHQLDGGVRQADGQDVLLERDRFVELDERHVVPEVGGAVLRVHLLPLYGVLLVVKSLPCVAHVPLAQPHTQVAVGRAATTQRPSSHHIHIHMHVSLHVSRALAGGRQPRRARHLHSQEGKGKRRQAIWCQPGDAVLGGTITRSPRQRS